MINETVLRAARKKATQRIDSLTLSDELDILNRADCTQVLALLCIADAIVYVGDSINAARTSTERVQNSGLGFIG